MYENIRVPPWGSVTLPHGAVGWSAVCNCGISYHIYLCFLIIFNGRSQHAPFNTFPCLAFILLLVLVESQELANLFPAN